LVVTLPQVPASGLAAADKSRASVPVAESMMVCMPPK
jgi:hypothetical protein